jgi:serine/threonine-protein kinase
LKATGLISMERGATPHSAEETSAANAPSREAVLDQLERLLNSFTFQAARAQKKFLQYTIAETVSGRGHLLKEYSLALEVFGRSKSFDPRLNNIVRVEASKLRAKLAKYYETEGRQDAVRIEFPKGRYAPVFRSRPEMAEAVALDEEPVSGVTVASPITASPIAWPRWKWPAVIVAGLLALAAGGLLSIRPRSQNVGSPVPSIAVLPFVNLNNDNNDFLGDGLTEDLIDSLARVPAVRVVARTSSFQYKGRTSDVRKIGKELNVRTVLEGTVRQAGNHLRITAQLNDTSSGYQLWSDSYDRDMKDAIAVQREISGSITAALGLEFARNSGAASGNPGRNAVNPEAYEAYLKGRYLWNKNAPEPVKAAIRYFEDAIRMSPEFALPYTGLAHAYTAMLVMTSTPSAELIPKIRTAASKALELDSSLGEAHLDLAETFLVDYEWDRAEREFKTALQLSPGEALAHRYYAFYLGKVGRAAEATSEVKTALDLDPISPFLASGLADSLYNERRFTEAAEQYRKTLELDPAYGFALRGFGRLLVHTKSYNEGVQRLLEARKIMDGDPMVEGELGYAYAVSENGGKVREILQGLLSRPGGGFGSALPISKIYFGLGKKDRGFEWLQKAVDQHELGLDLKTDPAYDSVRSDPRFQALLRKMNLT